MADGDRLVTRERSPLVGRWRITESDLWGRDFLDLVGPAHLELGDRGLGSFSFGAVSANIDYRVSLRDDRPAVEFSWEGYDEDMQVTGRGWAMLDEAGNLRVHLFFHCGDDSALVAIPMLHVPGGEPQRPMRARPLAGTKKRRRR